MLGNVDPQGEWKGVLCGVHGEDVARSVAAPSPDLGSTERPACCVVHHWTDYRTRPLAWLNQ